MDKLVRRYFKLSLTVAVGVAAVQALLVWTVAHAGVFGTGSRLTAALTVLALLVPMLLLGISGAMMILRLTSRQLGKVDRVLRLMSSGDLSARLSLPVDEETAGVVLSFNSMAEKVETTIEKVRRSDESRRQLLADVTHELNTPLTSVLGYLETLTMEDMPLSPERRQKLTGIAYEEAVNLRALIDDLTTLSRLDAEGLTIERARVPLGEVVERVVRRLSQMAEQRGVALCTELQPGVEVMGDAQRLDQVVRNLVENALRHTSAPGTVTVSLRRMLSSALLEVKDQGTGMPPEALAKIGQRFLRVDKSRARHTGGRGLGLAITVGLVEAHGGRVDFESAMGMGSGTRVRVTLPGVSAEEALGEVVEVLEDGEPSGQLEAVSTGGTAGTAGTGGADRAAGVAEGKAWDDRREAEVKARSAGAKPVGAPGGSTKGGGKRKPGQSRKRRG